MDLLNSTLAQCRRGVAACYVIAIACLLLLAVALFATALPAAHGSHVVSNGVAKLADTGTNTATGGPPNV